MKQISIAFAGLGSRGKDIYMPAFASLNIPVHIAAIADTDPEKVKAAAEKYNIPQKYCFSSAEEMLKQPKLADAVCIATMDRQHVEQAISALHQGYHILLEKPISPLEEECKKLSQVAAEKNLHVIVCHVLRYTAFYRTLKEQIDNGVIGDIVNVQAIENVGYWHQAHSFVRGNWANSDVSSPMILQKCCHDMDILLWLTGKNCKSLSSFGGLYHFNKQNAPQDAAKRCMDGCTAKANCPYDAEKIYMDDENTGIKHGNNKWPCNVLTLNPTEETVMQAITDGPYGRCVYHCDNNVVDHQVVNMEMTDGSAISFTMSAFSNTVSRHTKLMGTMGEIIADMEKNIISVLPFGKKAYDIDVNEIQKQLETGESGHGGGDGALAEEFASLISGLPVGQGISNLENSLESHYMAFAAEKSRLNGGTVIQL